MTTGEIAHVRDCYVVGVTPQKVFHKFLEYERLWHALADKPQVGRFVVDAPDGKLDMLGKSEGIAIIHNERVNNRAEYVEYEQERFAEHSWTHQSLNKKKQIVS